MDSRGQPGFGAYDGQCIALSIRALDHSIPLATGVLYPVFGLLLSPVVASVAMTFSSVSVITNALRLRRVEL